MFQYNKYDSCIACCEDITPENFVLFKDTVSVDWKSCMYCCDCITYILNTKVKKIIDELEKTDCKATMRRFIENSTIDYFYDKSVSENKVINFYFNGNEQSALYKNEYTEDFINELKAKIIQILDEK